MLKRNRETEAPLCEELPYWDFFEKPFAHIILNDGSVASGLAMNTLDIECFDAHRVNQMTASLRSAMDSISEGSSLQFLFTVDSDFSNVIDLHRERANPSSHDLIKGISDFRLNTLVSAQDNRELYRPRLFLFVKVPPLRLKAGGFFKKKEIFSDDATKSYEETLEILQQNIEVIRSSLQASGLHSSWLTREQILKIIYSTLNPRRSKSEPLPQIKADISAVEDKDLLEREPWLAAQSPREKLVFGDLILDYQHFVLDGEYHRIITLKNMPEDTYAGMLAGFLRMPFHYSLSLCVEIPPQGSEMAKLNQKRRMAHSLANAATNRASDLESESKLSSTEELIRELLNTGQRIYAVQLSVTLRASANDEGRKILDRQVRELLSRFRTLSGAEGLEETVGGWKIFKSTFPATISQLPRGRKMKTNNLADFLPVYAPREGDDDPVVLFRNRLNGLVSFNPFDPSLPNYNCLVTGSSGAGKSFLNNCILLQEMNRNQRVFIIDIGGSYKKLTEALGGQYLEINLRDDYSINPFDIPDPGQEPSNQKVKSLLAICEQMLSEEGSPRLPKLDRVLLEKAIMDLYEDKRRKNEIPVLSDLAKTLECSHEPKLNQMAKLLYSWTGDRPYGRLLDRKGKIRTDASICTFDLKGLSSYPDLQGVMILILTDFILSEIEKDKAHKKRIILDEAWELLKSPAAASFMEYCARTLRKTGSGITFITQGVEEIVASPVGPAILNNTATKFILLQRGDVEILQNTLRLNHQEVALIRSLEQRKGLFSEGFLMEGDHHQVVRIFPTPLEYWLSTSDAQDNSYLNDLMQTEGCGLKEAIQKASEKYPNGIAAGGYNAKA